MLFSLCICGTQSRYYNLHAATACHFLDNFESILELRNLFKADAASTNKRASDIQEDGVWVGEDVILAATDLLEREIHVFISASIELPWYIHRFQDQCLIVQLLLLLTSLSSSA